MKKTLILSAFILCGLISCSQSASQNAVASATYSGKAVAHGSMAAGQSASAVAAVPLKTVGAIGKGIDKAGDALIRASEGKKLPVSDEPIAGEPPRVE